MRRIVVAGGTGFFGAAAVDRLRADGFDPIVLSRRSGLDVEKEEAIRTSLRENDVVLDAVGPFQDRSPLLIDLAEEIGFDVVDISDGLDYSQRILERKKSPVRILTACSSVSVVPASFVTVSGISKPTRVSTYLAPETRHASRPGAGTSLLRSIGRPVTIFRSGRLQTRQGWSEARRFRCPLGNLEGRLFETADAVTLPPVWPSLREIDFWVDTRIPVLNRVFTWVGSWNASALLENPRLQALSLPMVRMLGPDGGAIGVEVDDRKFVILSKKGGYYTPVVPAVIACERMARGAFPGKGIVPANRQVDPEEFFAYLRNMEFRIDTLR